MEMSACGNTACVCVCYVMLCGDCLLSSMVKESILFSSILVTLIPWIKEKLESSTCNRYINDRKSNTRVENTKKSILFKFMVAFHFLRFFFDCFRWLYVESSPYALITMEIRLLWFFLQLNLIFVQIKAQIFDFFHFHDSSSCLR